MKFDSNSALADHGSMTCASRTQHFLTDLPLTARFREISVVILTGCFWPILLKNTGFHLAFPAEWRWYVGLVDAIRSAGRFVVFAV